MISGVSLFRKLNNASKPALQASQQLNTRISLRRSTRSASAPAGTVNRKNGNVPAEDIIESQIAGAPSEFIAQVAAISCAETQQPEITRADHSRK
jgi:hypothetical protein